MEWEFKGQQPFTIYYDTYSFVDDDGISVLLKILNEQDINGEWEYELTIKGASLYDYYYLYEQDDTDAQARAMELYLQFKKDNAELINAFNALGA